MSRRIIIALAFAVIVVGAVDVLAIGAGLEMPGQSYVESIDMLFNVRSGGNLSLGTVSGSISVQTWSREQIRLVVTKRTRAADPDAARRILEEFSVRALHGGKNLSLEGLARTQECARSVGVEFTLWVPKSYNLALKTKNGHIVLPEVDGAFSAHTDAGRIVLDCDTEGLDIEVEDRSEESGSVPVAPATREGGHEGPEAGARGVR